MILVFKPQKNSRSIEILLKKGKITIHSEIALNSEDIPAAIDRIFSLSKIDKYYIKKVQLASNGETSEITGNILKALTKTVIFLFAENQAKTRTIQ